MTRRIVVVDGHTMCPTPPNAPAPPGEPTWDALRELGQVEYHPRTPPDRVIERCADAPIVLTNKVVFDAAVIGQLPALRYLGVTATGVNVVDLRAVKAAGVVVTNTPAYSTDSVAQHVFALLLELTNRVGDHHAAARRGWAQSPDFAFTVAPITELAGLTLGIVGAGAIGTAVAKLGHALGMSILVASRTKKDLGVPVAWCDMDNLFAAADVVSLHCPLTDETRHLVNADRLMKMKPTAYLINTGRGPLVDEQALADALAGGKPAGAAVDVLSSEPPAAENPLLSARNCIVTPHVAWMSQAARRRLMAIVADNVRAFVAGKPLNVVNP